MHFFFFFFKVFHFALNVMCCLHGATSSVSSAFLLSLAVNKKSVLGRGGTYQPLQVEHRDRLSGHKTKQFASRQGSGVVKRNVFFHIISFIFFFSPSYQIFHRHASESTAPAVRVSVENVTDSF